MPQYNNRGMTKVNLRRLSRRSVSPEGQGQYFDVTWSKGSITVGNRRPHSSTTARPISGMVVSEHHLDQVSEAGSHAFATAVNEAVGRVNPGDTLVIRLVAPAKGTRVSLCSVHTAVETLAGHHRQGQPHHCGVGCIEHAVTSAVSEVLFGQVPRVDSSSPRSNPALDARAEPFSMPTDGLPTGNTSHGPIENTWQDYMNDRSMANLEPFLEPPPMSPRPEPAFFVSYRDIGFQCTVGHWRALIRTG